MTTQKPINTPPLGPTSRQEARRQVASYQSWRMRPVFLAQCHTFAVACRFDLDVNGFRSVPAYRQLSRVVAVQEARNQVASMVRQERGRIHRLKEIRAELLIVGQHNPKTGYLVDNEADHRLRQEMHSITDTQKAFEAGTSVGPNDSENKPPIERPRG